MHFKSTLPLSTKTNYNRNEIKRIHKICSKEKTKLHTPAHFINTLRNNDYPTSITRHLNNSKSRKLDRPSHTRFLKLPHFSESIIKEQRSAINKEGLDTQQAHSEHSLRQYLTKKKQHIVTSCTLPNKISNKI